MTTPPQDIPRSRMGRLARLAGLGLRATAGKLTADDPLKLAQSTAEVLGTLRGLATKVGQMASYVDGFTANPQSELYSQVMGKLCASTPCSDFTAVRATVEQELGGTLDSLFASFEADPLASASIGQVHRATLHDGRVVAVKVQHPGIEDALESDLKNLSMLESLARPLAGQKLDTKSIISVLCERFREELDYRIEAKNQTLFVRLHAGDRSIHVPAVVTDRSARRVLTTEFVQGRSLEEVSGDDQAARRAYAETMWRFVFRGIFVGRVFNTDPHPGNYIFQPDGRVCFLDFGSVQMLSEHMDTFGVAQYVSTLRGDTAAFDAATARFYRTDQAPLLEHTRHCFEPVASTPYRITREYAGGLLKESGGLPKRMTGKSEAPVELPLLNRLQFGFYSVLARLDVAADFAGVTRAILAERDPRLLSELSRVRELDAMTP